MQDSMNHIDNTLELRQIDAARLADIAERIRGLDADRQLIEWQNFLWHWFRYNTPDERKQQSA